jgi:hypothetical protein
LEGNLVKLNSVIVSQNCGEDLSEYFGRSRNVAAELLGALVASAEVLGPDIACIGRSALTPVLTHRFPLLLEILDAVSLYCESTLIPTEVHNNTFSVLQDDDSSPSEMGSCDSYLISEGGSLFPDQLYFLPLSSCLCTHTSFALPEIP